MRDTQESPPTSRAIVLMGVCSIPLGDFVSVD